MIQLAREYRGMTQKTLAALLEVAPGAVSRMESDLLAVSEEMLLKLSTELRLPQRFFQEPANIYPLGVHFYRKAKTIPQRSLTAINAEINVDSIRIDKLLDAAELAVTNIPNIDLETEPDKYKTAADVARAVRVAWSVPEGPIENMSKLLEDVGIIVVFGDFNTRFCPVDAMTVFPWRAELSISASTASCNMRFSFLQITSGALSSISCFRRLFLLMTRR